MIALDNVSVVREVPVLEDLSIRFEVGKVYGIIGRSGAGKTSLLKAIAGLVDISKGSILFEDQKLIGPSVKLIPGYDDIQLVNQDFGLEPFHTVRQNVKEKILSRHTEDQEVLIKEFLELVELDQLENRKANTLSGGEQQRLAIARALACEPKVLLLDEPFVHLDQRLRWKILSYLNALKEIRELLILLVSHDGTELLGFTDELIYLKDRRLERVGETNEIYHHPKSKEEAELLGPINEVKINGKLCLIRPTRFKSVEKNGIPVKFIKSIDTGMYFLNYFRTENDESILVVDNYEMSDVVCIDVK